MKCSDNTAEPCSSSSVPAGSGGRWPTSPGPSGGTRCDVRVAVRTAAALLLRVLGVRGMEGNKNNTGQKEQWEDNGARTKKLR